MADPAGEVDAKEWKLQPAPTVLNLWWICTLVALPTVLLAGTELVSVGQFPPVALADLRDARLRLLADDLLAMRGTLEAEVRDETALRDRRTAVEQELTGVQAREAGLETAAAEQAPRLALPGHGEPIEDPAGRAREIVQHHRDRLDETVTALGAEPRSGYELSYALFPDDRGASQRRFAVAETLSHIERLVAEGRAARSDDDGWVTYTQA
jgi:hypothetical protein